MKNLSLMIKNVLIMCLLALGALGITLYTTQEMKHVDDAYSQVIENRVKATVSLARGNRDLAMIEGSILLECGQYDG